MVVGYGLRRGLTQVLLAVAMCLVTAVPLWAQTTSASVSGSVKDAQGAVVPGATVTLTSTTKGTVLTAVSDEQGSFFFAYVTPDTYTLKVGLEGFQSAELPGLVVNANDRISVGGIALTIGPVTETVTVSGATPDMSLRSGERGFTLEATAIQNIAVNGRSFFGLAGLVPGVVPTTDTPTQVSNFNANGQRANSNNMTIDGVANIDTGDNGGNMAQTNLDAVAEFKVVTSSYQAEFGRAVGAQVQVVTKSGTQNFSGSGYWYGRRSDWNAETWWNNRQGSKSAESSRDDRGYTFGGPIWIPGTFNTRKDKLFFFWNQEFQRRKDPTNEQRVTVPTALERQGDFSQSVDANGNPYPYIRDYQLAQANPGWGCGPTDTRACFADGGVLGRIPANRLYQPTLKALGIYPLPNAPGNVGYNYRSQTPGKAPLDQLMFRSDYQLTDNWRLTGRYMRHTNKSELPYGIGGWSLGGNLDTVAVISDVPGQNIMFSSTGVLSGTTSLELSFGRAHNSLDHYSTSDGWTRTGANMTDLPLLYTGAVQLDMLPRFQFGGGRIGNAPDMRTHQAPFTNFNTTYDGVANLTKVMGPHALKIGFYYQKSMKDQSAFASHNGSYQFNNSNSNPFDSSHPFANAALGIYNNFEQASAFLKPKWRYTNYEWYLQDNWKTTGQLTLDYGVRFYYLTPQWDVSKVASNFLPDQFNPGQAVRLFRPAVIDGVRKAYDAATGLAIDPAYIGRIVPGSGDRFQGTFQGGQGIDETLTDGNKFRVSPRVGFAYDVTGQQNIVARGAFGIFYDRPQGNQVFDLVTNPPGMQVSQLQWGLASQIGGGATSYNAPVNLNPNVYNWKVPTVYQWNLGMQMRLPAQFVLDVAYVGSESRNLLQFRNLNAIDYGVAYTPAALDPTLGPSSTPGGNALPQDLLRPYQGYGNIRLWEFEAYSNYKALQTGVTRRFQRGLMFNVFYTRSAAKGTLGGDWDYARIDGRDKEANYGPLGFDRPNVLVASFVYQTPDVTQSLMRFLTNDWQLSGNYRWQSGTPYSPGFSIPGYGNVNLTGSYTEGARIALTGQEISRGYDTSDPYHQFNLDAFTAPQPGSIGLESPRYTMRNPPINTLDLSLAKSFAFGGRRRFEVRLDAFNALNHTQFTGVNSTLNFRSLTDPTITNLPFDASGNLVNRTGVGTVNGVRPARQLQVMTRFSF